MYSIRTHVAIFGEVVLGEAGGLVAVVPARAVVVGLPAFRERGHRTPAVRRRRDTLFNFSSGSLRQETQQTGGGVVLVREEAGPAEQQQHLGKSLREARDKRNTERNEGVPLHRGSFPPPCRHTPFIGRGRARASVRDKRCLGLSRFSSAAESPVVDATHRPMSSAGLAHGGRGEAIARRGCPSCFPWCFCFFYSTTPSGGLHPGRARPWSRTISCDPVGHMFSNTPTSSCSEGESVGEVVSRPRFDGARMQGPRRSAAV